MARLVRPLLLALVGVAAVLGGTCNAAYASTFTYDVTTVAPVDVRSSGGADSGSMQFTGMGEWSALPSVEAGGASTTQSLIFIGRRLLERRGRSSAVLRGPP